MSKRPKRGVQKDPPKKGLFLGSKKGGKLNGQECKKGVKMEKSRSQSPAYPWILNLDLRFFDPPFCTYAHSKGSVFDPLRFWPPFEWAYVQKHQFLEIGPSRNWQGGLIRGSKWPFFRYFIFSLLLLKKPKTSSLTVFHENNAKITRKTHKWLKIHEKRVKSCESPISHLKTYKLAKLSVNQAFLKQGYGAD